MKKFLCLSLCLCLLVGFVTDISYADDTGDYMESAEGYDCTIIIEDVFVSEESNSRLMTVSKQKVYQYSYQGNLLWKVVLNGTFQYNGVFATCIGSNCTTTVYASGWSCSSKSSYESDNEAIADVTMVKKVLGVVTETRYVHLTLTCDPNGNVS